MRKYIVSLLLIISIVAIGQARPAVADVGPTPINAQGGMLQPSVTTNVAMNDEKVTLTYSQVKTSGTGQAQQRYMDVHVTASFTMHNGGGGESLKVYFPSSDGDFVNGFDNKDITNFTVNGTKITALVDVPAGFGAQGNTIKAYQWDQNFPNGDTIINISYDSQSTSNYNYFYLTYVLGTGRNWAGNIKNGEVDFVLPLTVPDYAVTAKPPMLKASSLPYALDGNTIKVTFTDYEPAADAAISLGLSNPDVIKSIQQRLSAKTQSLYSYLDIASEFWTIAGGPHCVICTEPGTTQADKYYNLALDKATNESENNRVLNSYAWGNSSDSDISRVLNLFTRFAKHQICSDNDETCWADQREFFETTPFGYDTKTKVVDHADFLATYACRVRPFNANTAGIVEAYAGKRLDSCPIATVTATQNNSANQTTPASSNNIWLLVGLIAGGVVLVAAAATTTILIIRHKRKEAAKAAGTTEKPKTDETNKPGR